jgi:GNAT superfamily N-acetyltransferase
MRLLWISTCLIRTSRRRWRPCRVICSPGGELLLARYSNGTPVGCVGLRPIGAHGCCEMKRLYVYPEGRGFGLGERLVDAVVKEAERIGYRGMRLDTLPSRAVPKARVRANRALLRHSGDRHDFHAPLAHPAFAATIRTSPCQTSGCGCHQAAFRWSVPKQTKTGVSLNLAMLVCLGADPPSSSRPRLTNRSSRLERGAEDPSPKRRTYYLAAVTGSIKCSYFVPGYMT